MLPDHLSAPAGFRFFEMVAPTRLRLLNDAFSFFVSLRGVLSQMILLQKLLPHFEILIFDLPSDLFHVPSIPAAKLGIVVASSARAANPVTNLVIVFSSLSVFLGFMHRY